MAEAQAARGKRAKPPNVLENGEDQTGFGRQGGEDPRQTGRGLDDVGDKWPKGSPPSSTVSVEQPLPKSRHCSICGAIGHNAQTCTAEGVAGVTATKAPKKPAPEAVGSIAPMIVGTANFFVVTTFGGPCGLTELEGKLLIPSVQRTLERMPAAAATKAAVIIDPLVIATVLVMWGRRIAAIKTAEAREKYAVKPAEQARANGVAGFTQDVEAQQSPIADEMPLEPNANGVPQSIREAFDDRI